MKNKTMIRPIRMLIVGFTALLAFLNIAVVPAAAADPLVMGAVTLTLKCSSSTAGVSLTLDGAGGRKGPMSISSNPAYYRYYFALPVGAKSYVTYSLKCTNNSYTYTGVINVSAGSYTSRTICGYSTLWCR